MSVVSNNKRIAKNTFLLYLRMFLQMLVSLYTSRIILNTLGIEDFGIYNVVGGVVVLFSFLGNALTQASQRFLTYALGENNLSSFNKIFNVNLLIYLGTSLLLTLILETVGLWIFHTKLVIPEERWDAALCVYQFSIFTFVLSLLRIPYNAAIIAHERMSFYAYVSIIEVILKLLIVYCLSLYSYDKLIFYALLTTLVTFIINVGYFIYCNKNFIECKLSFFWDSVIFYRLISFTGWNLLGSSSVIASSQGVYLLMNVYFGVIVNAAMGIANQISNAVNQFVSNFQIAFNPQIIKSCASKDFSYLNMLVLFSSKFSFFLLMLIVLPLLAETELVLYLWLSSVPDYLERFTQILLLLLLFDTFSGSLVVLLQASGRIKKYQIAITVLYTVSFLLSWLLYSIGMDVYSVFIVRFVVSSVLTLAVRLFLINTDANVYFNIRKYLIDVVLKSFLIFFCCSLFVFGMRIFLKTYTPLINIFILTFTNVVFSSILFYFLGLNRNEKTKVTQILKTKIFKYINATK